MYMYIHIYTHIYIYTHTYIYIHILIYIYIYIYLYLQLCLKKVLVLFLLELSFSARLSPSKKSARDKLVVQHTCMIMHASQAQVLMITHVLTQPPFFNAANLSSSTCVGNAPNNVLLSGWLCQMHDTCGSHGIPGKTHDAGWLRIGSSHKRCAHAWSWMYPRHTSYKIFILPRGKASKSHPCNIHAHMLLVDQAVSNKGLSYCTQETVRVEDPVWISCQLVMNEQPKRTRDW